MEKTARPVFTRCSIITPPFSSLVSAPLCLILMAAFLALGCASSGPKYINLAYTGSPGAASAGTLGISQFMDNRKDMARGEIGYRVLNDKSREIFLVPGLDLAAVLTDQTQAYLEKKGLTILPVPGWSPDLKGLSTADASADQVLTARINTFELSAEKKGALTRMVLTIDLSFYLGNPSEKKLTTIPVALTLERTEINFTREKVEAFFNQTLAEVLEKALPLD